MKRKIFYLFLGMFAAAMNYADASLVKIACLKGKVPESLLKDLACVADYDARTKDGMCFIKFEFGKNIKKEAAQSVPEEWYESKALATYSKKTKNGVVAGQAIVFDDSVIQGAKSFGKKTVKNETSFWSRLAFWRSSPVVNDTKIDVQALAYSKDKTNKQIGQAVGIANPEEFPATLEGLAQLKNSLGTAPTDCAIPTRE